jgi:hypothetical protein
MTPLCYRIVTMDSELVDIQCIDAGQIVKNYIYSTVGSCR